jgi:hypothetical protein
VAGSFADASFSTKQVSRRLLGSCLRSPQIQLGLRRHQFSKLVGRDNHLGRWSDKHDGRW